MNAIRFGRLYQIPQTQMGNASTPAGMQNLIARAQLRDKEAGQNSNVQDRPLVSLPLGLIATGQTADAIHKTAHMQIETDSVAIVKNLNPTLAQTVRNKAYGDTFQSARNCVTPSNL